MRAAAHGGQGVVWQALDHLHDRLVALKVRKVRGSDRKESILREARVILGLGPHPGLPLVRDDFFERDSYYLVMDWVEGPNLSKVLGRRGSPGLTLESVTGYLDQVAATLDHLHAHGPPVVHGDVKPANVILTRDRGAVLVDFGLSAPDPGSRSGTPGFVAPELAAGAPPTPAADVYAFAATSFTLLTGSPPAPGSSLREAKLPRAQARRVRQVMRAGLAIEPSARPHSATALLDELRGRPVPATAPPAGPTITFVFTDIEGSTRLLRELGDVYLEVLHDHNQLVRAAIKGHGGYEVKTEGDSFFVAFPTADAALGACLDAQLALCSFDWPTGEPVRVRMAVHTGDAQRISGDYFGLAVHEAARMCSAAHGSQIVVSAQTAGLAGPALPADAILQDLGTYILRDFPEPRRLLQLCHPELAPSFPPLRTNAARKHNLPAFPTALIGRRRELAEMRALLAQARLVTATGPGGIGKTRLALEVAESLRDDFPAGVWFVPLAAVTDPGRVQAAVADALGVRTEDITEHLGGDAALLVLDNFEQLAPAAPDVAALMAACPQLRVLVTSREPLRVRGEKRYDVPPLGLPSTSEDAAGSEAVQLFVERAAANDGEFALTVENNAAVSELCRRLDGLPLAIEIAAARATLLEPQALLERLEGGLDALGEGPRDLPSRQRTLRAAISWSHELLGPREQAVFRRFAAFSGSASLPAAEEVCGEGEDVLAAIGSLVDRSLLRRERSEGGELRLSMLETIRQFARERLEESDEDRAAARRHAEWFLSLAEQAEPELVGAEQSRWFSRLEADHDNLRLALSTFASDGDGALRLCAALMRFWVVRGHWAEGRAFVEAALSIADGDPRARARALLAAGYLAACQDDYDTALVRLNESLRTSESCADPAYAGQALNQLGELARRRGDAEAAAAHYTEAMSAMRRAGDRRGVALVLVNQAGAAMEQGRPEDAMPLYEEALATMQQLGDVRTTATVLGMLGLVRRASGELDGAQGLLEESLALYRRLGDRRGMAETLQNLGLVASDRGDRASMAALWEESLAAYRELRSPRGVAETLSNLGWLTEDSDSARSRSFYEESLALVRRLGHEKGAVAAILLDAGNAALRRGDHAQAETCLSESAELHAELGSPLGQASALQGLARTAISTGERERGTALYRRALILYQKAGNEQGASGCLAGLRSAENADAI